MRLVAERRAHLVVAVEFLHGLVRQEQMMHRHAGRHLHAVGLGVTDKGNSPSGGHVREMERSLRVARQVEVAGHCKFLSQGGSAFEPKRGADNTFVHLPAMRDLLFFRKTVERCLQLLCILHGHLHHLGVGYGVLAIADTYGTRPHHVIHLGQFLAFQPLGDGAQWQRIHHIARSIAQQIFHSAFAIHHRKCLW